MNVNKRVKDVSQVFDSQWNVNHNYKERKKFLDSRKEHFDKIHNIKEKKKNTRKREILWASSVDGQIERLNEKIDAAVSSERIARKNDFKSNFR